MSNPVLECKSLSMTFNDAGHQLSVIENVDFLVYPSNFISIVGNSGSGKSTLLHLLAGLESPTSGEVYLHGEAIQRLNKTQRALMRRQHLGFVYQLHHLLPEFSALENIAMPLRLRGDSPKAALEASAYWLEQVGLSHRSSHRPSALSGGERQRVAIARALCSEPSCVLADEPTGNLDEHSALQVQDLLIDLASKGTSFIVVTHDRKFAARAPLQYKMHDGLLLPVEKINN